MCHSVSMVKRGDMYSWLLIAKGYANNTSPLLPWAFFFFKYSTKEVNESWLFDYFKIIFKLQSRKYPVFSFIFICLYIQICMHMSMTAKITIPLLQYNESSWPLFKETVPHDCMTSLSLPSAWVNLLLILFIYFTRLTHPSKRRKQCLKWFFCLPYLEA